MVGEYFPTEGGVLRPVLTEALPPATREPATGEASRTRECVPRIRSVQVATTATFSGSSPIRGQDIGVEEAVEILC
jgi:hypothetical protein